MFSVLQIARLVDGCLLRSMETTPERVIHDSRLVQEGDLFIALKGGRTDGHEFLEEAFVRGACGAIVSDSKAVPETAHNVICVEEPLGALWALAAAWRREHSATFIGITGSCGKTTTKALLAHLLAADTKVFAAPESYNTEIGLPLALLSMSTSAQVGIFELGASTPGEIAPLANLLSPQIAILTMVGRTHLEGFGDSKTVAEEKWELVRALPSDGTAIVNADCLELAPFIEQETRRLVSFGLESGMVRGTITRSVPNLHVKIAEPPLGLICPLIGRHNATNLLGAVSCALHLSVPPQTIEERVATFESVSHRLQLLRVPFGYLLDDTYNANPESTAAALHVLAEFDLPVERRALVFGDMLELGEESARFHRQILDLAIGLGVFPILPVGELATQAVEEVRPRLPRGRFVVAPRDQLADRIRESLRGKQTLLLVKGSRRLGLEQIVDQLRGAPANKA